MEPLLSWVVCGFSVFLLTAGGYLLARAFYVPRLHAWVQQTRAQEKAHKDALQAREAALSEAWTAREELAHKLALSDDPPGASPGPSTNLSSRAEGFDEPTRLPDPVGYFGGTPEQAGAPPLQQISESEYEISAAASADALEERPPGLDARDETRQFNLHSSEAVVHFLQRIDELNDENRDLKVALADRDQMLKDKQQEGSGTVQRFADLDATVIKLRQELERRNHKIKQLQARLAEELRDPAQQSPQVREQGAETQSHDRPLGKPGMIRAAHDSPPAVRSMDAPTLQVTRVDEGELCKGQSRGKLPR